MLRPVNKDRRISTVLSLSYSSQQMALLFSRAIKTRVCEVLQYVTIIIISDKRLSKLLSGRFALTSACDGTLLSVLVKMEDGKRKLLL